MTFSLSQQEAALSVWHQYIRPNLGPVAHRQFVRATKTPQNILAERVIKPNLFQVDAFGAEYYPVDIDARTPGRNHYLAQALATDPDVMGTYNGDPWPALTFFTNPLFSCEPTYNEVTRQWLWEPPKHRVVLGSHQVFTYEFDVPSVDFLKEQLSWLRSSKNPLDCKMGDLFRYCSGFGDFAGITVNYSGNKSFHIHIVFETALATDKLSLGGSTRLREGLMSHWDYLHVEVLKFLGLPEGIKADSSLRAPES